MLVFVLGYLLVKGGSSLNVAFFTELPKPVGETGGGMANALAGSAKMLGIAALTGLPLGLLAGLYLSEFAGRPMAHAVRYAADLLNGMPSIVIGIFVYTLVVLPMKHFSTLAGGLALGIIMIPIMTRSSEEFLRAVPVPLREASLALGATRTATIIRVVLPAAARGIVTAAMLGLARVAGETAPLLFTSLSNAFWSPGLLAPTASLPVMIYNYAVSPYEDWQRQAWAAGLVLLSLVFAANLVRGRRSSRSLRGAAGVAVEPDCRHSPCRARPSSNLIQFVGFETPKEGRVAFRLIPKEEKFYQDFLAITDELKNGARLLEEMLASNPPAFDKAEEIKEIEHKCDFLSHEVYQRLHRTFVTPLDREDIHALARSLDDIMDEIDATAGYVRLYRIPSVRYGARELARIITDSCKAVRLAMLGLEDRKTVSEHLVEINRLENEADRMHLDAVSRLFEEETDAILVFKWKEILDRLEDATDRCEDVADVIEGVVLKNA